MILESIALDMDFRIQKNKDGEGYRIYDLQTCEYLGDRTDNTGDEAYVYKTKEEIIDRLETYIDDYWFREAKEELSYAGYNQSCAWEYLYDMLLKHIDEVEHPENFTYNDVLDCLVHPEKITAVLEEEIA